MNSNRVPNKLINEKSPYLLQHAYNPVHWFPWGEEAFTKAQKEDKPIFLSIGYSTCHWCHVMEQESFEDQEVAAVLNREFISIKVDREERPDVDAVYMAVCQAMTGSGGWPLTVILTPQQEPFWAGTYLPKTAKYGHYGLLDLLEVLVHQWENNRSQLLQTSQTVIKHLQQSVQNSRSLQEPNRVLLQKAVTNLSKHYDPHWGGFGVEPKFPVPHNLLFLLQYAQLEEDKKISEMAQHTLVQMYRGGIFDHIGGGFSRYSTDAMWLVPHFEKMLYDNALLAQVYLQAYKITKHALFARVATHTLDYVLRELADEEGGFHCGQDADSDGVEGKYYVFTPQELQQQLGQKDAEKFCKWFDITEHGNFEGKNIPNLLRNPEYEQENEEIMQMNQRLYAYRLQRTNLHQDDKVLTAWNALLIRSLAQASIVLGNDKYLKKAQSIQQFLAKHLTDVRGRLFVRWRDGQAAHSGYLDDYAFYADALLELYDATFCIDYIQQAIQVTEQMLAWFEDTQSGGFYLYASDAQTLITRPKEVYDGAMPSGNSVAAHVLVRLAQLTAEPKWQQAADRQLRFLAGAIVAYPSGYTAALLAMLRVLYPSRELVCASADPHIGRALVGLQREQSGNNLTILLKTKENEKQLAQLAPFTAPYAIPEQGTAYYLCTGGVCSAPVDSLEALLEQLH